VGGSRFWVDLLGHGGRLLQFSKYQPFYDMTEGQVSHLRRAILMQMEVKFGSVRQRSDGHMVPRN
jgi:hypothetical protein